MGQPFDSAAARPGSDVFGKQLSPTNEATPMLAEKFILLMETLKSHAAPDGVPRVVSTSPDVPVKLPAPTISSLKTAYRGAF